ncbi:hypothetical protein B0I32_106328 [Nonomuraea fuscirosea]|uniref:Uncharacterized protein n=1 Tax=Nonomuraea fuscirosea TaxID=1291556 RepID=A0A2T0N2I9_9ACTN|nr:hypothetical protein [Nonomuraea fuscirosea]PRX66192.1 hypothetical protein B0I32_106328 [Nonomuraea fuscirosea]
MLRQTWRRRIRRWRAGLALLLAGMICLAASFIFQDSPWYSSALTEVGATFLLFAPLLMLQRRIEKRFHLVETGQQAIEDRQNRTINEIAALSEEVAQNKDDIQRTLDQLSEAVFERLQTARTKDKERFAAVSANPTFESLGDALQRARELGLISDQGCRVPLRETPLFVRFHANMPHDVQLTLEDMAGNAIHTAYWAHDNSAEAVLVDIIEKVQLIGQYPGDVAFYPTHIFVDLRNLLDLAHRHSTGESRMRNPLGPLIQFCDPQWVITETKVMAIDEGYTIEAHRLNEMDWYDHVRPKGWADPTSLFDALESARALYRNGRLAVYPPDPPF